MFKSFNNKFLSLGIVTLLAATILMSSGILTQLKIMTIVLMPHLKPMVESIVMNISLKSIMRLVLMIY